MNSTVSTDGLSDIALSDGGSPVAGAHANGHVTPAGLPLAGMGLTLRTATLTMYVEGENGL